MPMDPQDRYRLAEWGYGLYREGLYEQSGVIFEALRDDDPSEVWAACALATSQLAQGQVLEALQTLEPHLASPQARLVRAETLAIAGNTREASALMRTLPGAMGPAWERVQLRLRAQLAPDRAR